MVKRWMQRNWKKSLVIVACLALIAAHSIWSQLKFDSVNIWLGVLAVVILLLPDVNPVLPYLRRVKRFKAWQLEFELNDLQEKIERSEAESIEAEIAKSVTPEVEEVLKEASKDPRAALLLLSSKIETTLQGRATEIMSKYSGTIGLARTDQNLIRIGVDQGLFPPTTLSAYKDFRGIRNRIAHDYSFQVDNATILSLISLGSELLKLLSAKKPEPYS